MAEHNLQSIAFPRLDEAQISKLAQCTTATPKVYRDGQTLFAVGDRDFKFFIVKSGEIEIVDHSGDAPKTVTVHRKGQFTGEITHLTGNPAVVSAIARGDCEVYQISGDALRRVLNQCPAVSDIILQAFIARRQLLRESSDFTGLRVIGSRYSTDTFRVRDFMAKNRMLFTWVDIDTDPQVDLLLKQFGVTEADTPVVACSHMLLLRNPSNRQLADEIGIRQPLEQTVYDLVVVVGGLAGLAAAVYGASEGLRTVVLERTAPGGQAGSSMRIENYLGFPTGLTGSELADRAILQANKFGARLSVPTPVTRLAFEKVYPVVHLDGGETVTAKCLLIATGADYRWLGVEGCERFEGKGIYYAATPTEVQMCQGAQVVLVGGGNSAGQAAVYLAQHARQVLLLIRGDDLYKNMSSYLAKRIEQTANIELLFNTTIRRMIGDGHLGSVEIVNKKTGQERTVETPAVFSFIGAVPRTDWLPPEIERDAQGFIRTGAALAQSPHWTAKRQPFLLETSRPGVFAAGDVRSGSAKRVASAVGEGSMAVQFVHEYLKEM
ncbi:MAG: cyclic nucleotide-binding domain-containing protein [Nitrospirae bacterium]|nr:MAG: cyclic nucleotide-binding domain-containing protein [Nitrospirota bacterium]